MRIKELADLAGSTVRTVRYYHQIGLLPVPVRRDGVRDYDLTHVARLVRIRWLAEAGISLADIAGVVRDAAEQGTESDRQSVLSDLHAGVKSLDEQIARMYAQRERLAGLIAAVERDEHLSPMPAVVARFYEQMLARAADDRTRRLIRRERDFVELAFYRGEMPAESVLLYEGLNEAGLARSLDSYRVIADRSERSHALDDREIEQVVAGVLERITRHLGSDLPRVMRSLDLNLVRRAADLYIQLADPREHRLDRAITDALLSLIEKGKAE